MNGEAEHNLSTNIFGFDPSSGTKKPLSVIEDDDGNFVLRTVDVAPSAYDEDGDRIKIKSTQEIDREDLFEEYEIRDTGSHWFDHIFPIDYKDLSFVYRNLHDVDLYFQIYMDIFGAARPIHFTDENGNTVDRFKLETGDRRGIITKENFPVLEMMTTERCRVRVFADVEPSSGSLSLSLMGRRQ